MVFKGIEVSLTFSPPPSKTHPHGNLSPSLKALHSKRFVYRPPFSQVVRFLLDFWLWRVIRCKDLELDAHGL